MPKVLRALLISAVATGSVVVAMNLWRRREANDQHEAGDQFVDAEKLSEEERIMLSSELDAML